jgi:hypothetical protein
VFELGDDLGGLEPDERGHVVWLGESLEPQAMEHEQS